MGVCFARSGMVPASPRIGGAFGAQAPQRFDGGRGGPPGGGYGASRGGYGGGGRGRGGPDDRMIGQVTTISKGPFRFASVDSVINLQYI
jgi:hypothetical protein